jgi:hypothetical protein
MISLAPTYILCHPPICYCLLPPLPTCFHLLVFSPAFTNSHPARFQPFLHVLPSDSVPFFNNYLNCSWNVFFRSPTLTCSLLLPSVAKLHVPNLIYNHLTCSKYFSSVFRSSHLFSSCLAYILTSSNLTCPFLPVLKSSLLFPASSSVLKSSYLNCSQGCSPARLGKVSLKFNVFKA